MHSTARVWKFEVKILINVTCSMGKIMGKIVGVHVVVMDEATTVLTFGLEVESDIIPVGRPHFVIGMLRVSEILRERKGHASSLQKSHFTLEVFIIACVVLNGEES